MEGAAEDVSEDDVDGQGRYISRFNSQSLPPSPAPGGPPPIRLDRLMQHSPANFAAVLVLIGMALQLSSCSEKRDGDISFREASKGFGKELTPAQRKAAIKELQTETTSKP